MCANGMAMHDAHYLRRARDEAPSVLLSTDGSVLAEYKRMARKAGKVWREHGALEFRECVADDVKPGKRTSFPQSVKLEDGETVILAWAVYESRAQRDAKHDALVHEREVNRALRQELAETRADLSKLASINQVLVHEVALLKGMATGKVVSILQPKGTGI